LYYYKYSRANSEKEYYEYLIGSEVKPQKVGNTILSNIIVESADKINYINPDKSMMVVNYSEEMYFYKIPNWRKEYNSIYSYDFKLPKIEFDLKKHMVYDNGDQFYLDSDTKKTILFGGISWHNRKNILYFDNSGITFRCIWKIDFDKDTVSKIVPEHEAIHPYFFEVKNKEYIAYVERNKIMICESPQ